jgi:hypothetical protein
MDDSHKLLYVIINNEPILEFDRSKPVPGHQRQYLDNMDARMDQGIQLGADFIKAPNALQRSQFVANSLVNALQNDQDGIASAMCTYLAKRMPDLQQIKCVSKEGDSDKELSIELVFDRSFEKAQQEQSIQFFKPDDVTSH